jgi:hypothetical protein
MPVRLIRQGPLELGRDPGRPAGIHLSSLVHAAIERAGAGYRNSGGPPDERLRLAMQIGLAWEDWYGPRIEGAIYHPGSLLYEDVWYSPDALDMDRLILHEIKTTSRTPRGQDPFQTLRWNLQVQGYLWCLGQGEWTRAQIHVLYLGQPPAPVLEVWEREYGVEELKRTWYQVLEPMKEFVEAETNGEECE